MIRSDAVLRHAKGQPCMIHLPGICNSNPETTVFCHLNSFGKGMGMKTHDILGFFGCASCHAYVDVGHGTKPLMTDLELAQSVMGAVCMTWVQLVTDKVITVPQNQPTPSYLRPVPARKPKAERAKVPSNPDRIIQSRNDLRRKERT